MEPDDRKEIYINLIHYPVYSLGIGKRIGIWFQGCSIRCNGCIADYAWDLAPEYKNTLADVTADIAKYQIMNPQGITISGGEPFDQPEALHALLKRLNAMGFNDIMLYSGYRFRLLNERFQSILSFVAALVDGPFMREKETDALWKGSDNQRMYILTEDEELKKKYHDYMKKKCEQRILQIVEKKDKVYIIGIPRQKDVEVMKHGARKDMPRMRGKASS